MHSGGFDVRAAQISVLVDEVQKGVHDALVEEAASLPLHWDHSTCAYSRVGDIRVEAHKLWYITNDTVYFQSAVDTPELLRYERCNLVVSLHTEAQSGCLTWPIRNDGTVQIAVLSCNGRLLALDWNQ